MSEARSTTESVYDTKTIIFRVFTVFVYVVFGSVVFHFLEKDEAAREVAEFEENYDETMRSILRRFIQNETDMINTMAEIRESFLQDVVPKEWDYLGGVNITIQVITTIGYGNITPRTVAGRMFLIIYATIGIPLMVMLLMTIGEKFEHMIRSSIISFERKNLKKSRPQNIHKKSVIAVFAVTAIFLVLVSAIGAVIEDWDFSLAVYVWFVTITTIGFGDYVPQSSGTSDPVLLTLEIIYIAIVLCLSLALMACIINTLSDWVQSTKLPSKNDLKQSLSRITKSHSAHTEPSINMALPRPFTTPLPPQTLPNLGTQQMD